MSKRYHLTTRAEADAVVWDGNNSRDLAELLGKPVTAQPEGIATWPDDDEGVATANLGDAVIRWIDGPDKGELAIIPGKEFTAAFVIVRQMKPKAAKPAAAAPPVPGPAHAPAAAGAAAQSADA